MGLARLWFLGFHPLFSLLSTAFWIWMLVDCFQKRGPSWAWVVGILGPTGGIVYFIAFYLPESGIRLPRRRYNRRQFEELKALKRSGLTTNQWKDLGYIHQVRREWHEAIAAYQQAIDRSPDLEYTRIDLAKCLIAAGQRNEALPHLEAVIATNGFYRTHAARLQTRTLLELQQPARALETITKERGGSQAAEVYYLYGYALAANQRGDEAKMVLRQLIDEAALHPRAERRWIGHARMLLRRLTKSSPRLLPLK